MAYQHIKIPSAVIKVNKGFSLSVPDNPIMTSTGVDITPVMLKVVDAAVKKAYGGKRKIVWMEMFAGEKIRKIYGENVWSCPRRRWPPRGSTWSIVRPPRPLAASARFPSRCAR